MYQLYIIVIYMYLFNRATVDCNYTARGRLDVLLTDSGEYSVLIDNEPWLRSAPTYFTVRGRHCSTADGSLRLRDLVLSTGSDVLGHWTEKRFRYEPPSSRDVHVDVSVRTYTGKPFVLFGQHFATQIPGSSTGNRDAVSSAFPSFYVEQPHSQNKDMIGYLAYGGIMFGDTRKSFGIWGDNVQRIASGLDSGPLVLLSRTGNALVVSPFNQFMAASTVYGDHDNRSTVSWGIMGSVSEIPADFTYWTIMYLSKDGINSAFSNWGDLMRMKYRRSRSRPDLDLTLSFIGYWTDNGAYYYYNPAKGLSYEDTLLQVKKYATKNKIPYRYVQYDSWWYYAGEGRGHGCTNWTSKPDVFPSGLKSMWKKTGWPVLAHNRWWSDKNVYAKQNGGRFPFVIEPGTHKGLPLSLDFWDALLGTAKQWGMAVYEQDWINGEFDGMSVTVSDVGAGEAWLLQMGAAAQKRGVRIQYCMSPSRAALQTLLVPAVTQARVTNDYMPGDENWRIGMSSMFAHALGITPVKDNFWTTEYQPGNLYNGSEPYTELNSLVATLSTGPVGISDGVNYSNVSLIYRSCNSDGLILKPSRPVMAVDAQYLEACFSGFSGELWSTYSDISRLRFGVVVGVDTGRMSLGPSAAGFGPKFERSVVFERSNVQGAVDFSDQRPLVLTGCTRRHPCLYYTSPIITLKGQRLVLYGELSKWVVMSPQRVTSIVLSSDDVLVRLAGSTARETVVFTFLLDSELHHVRCRTSGAGFVVVSVILHRCYNGNNLSQYYTEFGSRYINRL